MKKAAFLLFAGAVVLAAPLTAKDRLYDDFSGRMISFGKWKGAGGDFWMAEARRDIDRNGVGGNRLHLAMTAYSPQRDDGLGTGGIWGLYFANPDMKGATYDVEVRSATARACPENPGAEVVTGPEFRGRFFNTQSNPSSEMGDVEVAVGFDRRPGDVDGNLTAAFIYQMCNDAGCTSHTTLGQGTFGTVAPGTTNNIGVHWEHERHRFVFELNGVKTVSPYGVADTSPPFAPDKEIDVARNIVNCAERPRPYTSVDAYFSNVIVDR